MMFPAQACREPLDTNKAFKAKLERHICRAGTQPTTPFMTMCLGKFEQTELSVARCVGPVLFTKLNTFMLKDGEASAYWR